jgi:hypothetical protein
MKWSYTLSSHARNIRVCIHIYMLTESNSCIIKCLKIFKKLFNFLTFFVFGHTLNSDWARARWHVFDSCQKLWILTGMLEVFPNWFRPIKSIPISQLFSIVKNFFRSEIYHKRRIIHALEVFNIFRKALPTRSGRPCAHCPALCLTALLRISATLYSSSTCRQCLEICSRNSSKVVLRDKCVIH